MQELIRLISALDQLAAQDPGQRATKGSERDAPPTPLERLAVLGRMVDESHRIQRAWFTTLLDRGHGPGGRVEDPREVDPQEHAPLTIAAGDDPDAGLLKLLRGFQRVLLEHPIAAQAAFSALVAEGRRYAETSEGAEWSRRLEGSELLRQGRRVWEAASLSMLETRPDAALPSSYIDALLSAADHPEVEALLRRLQGADEAAAGGAAEASTEQERELQLEEEERAGARTGSR